MKLPIESTALRLHIPNEALLPYGKEVAKIDLSLCPKGEEKGKLILVTAMTPTSKGEGKTTVSIGLLDGFCALGEETALCLREPALGPVFGIKGGATGFGKSRILPEEEINLHFTGDIHALESAHNLISAALDNSLYFENPLHIDPERILWPRAMDMNDRALRNVEVGLGKMGGVPRKDHFVITVASELMAMLCLSKDEEDFLARLREVVVAYSTEGKEITVGDLKVTHAVMRLLKDAFKPNLVRTLEGNPVLVHGGPFANIATGTSSLIATKFALSHASYVIQEAGFGSDLGAEKFLDVVSPTGELKPRVAVLVSSLRALKAASEGKEENSYLEEGLKNLFVHYENLRSYGLPVVVAINHFPEDEEEELLRLKGILDEKGIPNALSEGVLKGGEGMKDLARLVKEEADKKMEYHSLYEKSEPLKEKIEKVAKNIYRSKEVEFSPLALEKLDLYEKAGYGDFYVCLSKTPMSLGDDPKLGPTPINNVLHIRDVLLNKGAGFVIPLSGSLLRMPGLPCLPRAVLMEGEAWK